MILGELAGKCCLLLVYSGIQVDLGRGMWMWRKRNASLLVASLLKHEVTLVGAGQDQVAEDTDHRMK